MMHSLFHLTCMALALFFWQVHSSSLSLSWNTHGIVHVTVAASCPQPRSNLLVLTVQEATLETFLYKEPLAPLAWTKHPNDTSVWSASSVTTVLIPLEEEEPVTATNTMPSSTSNEALEQQTWIVSLWEYPEESKVSNYSSSSSPPRLCTRRLATLPRKTTTMTTVPPGRHRLVDSVANVALVYTCSSSSSDLSLVGTMTADASLSVLPPPLLLVQVLHSTSTTTTTSTSTWLLVAALLFVVWQCLKSRANKQEEEELLVEPPRIHRHDMIQGFDENIEDIARQSSLSEQEEGQHDEESAEEENLLWSGDEYEPDPAYLNDDLYDYKSHNHEWSEEEDSSCDNDDDESASCDHDDENDDDEEDESHPATDDEQYHSNGEDDDDDEDDDQESCQASSTGSFVAENHNELLPAEQEEAIQDSKSQQRRSLQNDDIENDPQHVIMDSGNYDDEGVSRGDEQEGCENDADSATNPGDTTFVNHQTVEEQGDFAMNDEEGHDSHQTELSLRDGMNPHSPKDRHLAHSSQTQTQPASMNCNVGTLADDAGDDYDASGLQRHEMNGVASPPDCPAMDAAGPMPSSETDKNPNRPQTSDQGVVEEEAKTADDYDKTVNFLSQATITSLSPMRLGRGNEILTQFSAATAAGSYYDEHNRNHCQQSTQGSDDPPLFDTTAIGIPQQVSDDSPLVDECKEHNGSNHTLDNQVAVDPSPTEVVKVPETMLLPKEKPLLEMPPPQVGESIVGVHHVVEATDDASGWRQVLGAKETPPAATPMTTVAAPPQKLSDPYQQNLLQDVVNQPSKSSAALSKSRRRKDSVKGKEDHASAESSSYVSTLPPDSSHMGSDDDMQAKATAQADPCTRRSREDERNEQECQQQPSPADNRTFPSPDGMEEFEQQGKRRRGEEPSALHSPRGTKSPRLDNNDDNDFPMSDDYQQCEEDSSSAPVQVVQVVFRPSPKKRQRRRSRPFSASQIVPDWVPSRGLQGFSRSFMEDSKWNMNDGTAGSTQAEASPIPRSIKISRGSGSRKVEAT